MIRARVLAAALGAAFLAVSAVPARAGLALDTTFDTDGFSLVNLASGFDGARDVAVDGNGDTVAAGTSGQGDYDYLVVTKMDSTGALVSGFGTSGYVQMLPGGTPQKYGGADGLAVAIEPSTNKIVVAGNWNMNDGNGYHTMVVKLLTDGTPDPDFGTDGVSILDLPNLQSPQTHAVLVLDDGSVLLGGGSATPNSIKGFIAKLTNKGAIDTTFASSGSFTFDNVYQGTPVSIKALHVTPAGKIVGCGGNLDFVAVRLDSTGKADTSFSGDGIAFINVGYYTAYNQQIPTQEDGEDCELLTDGRILIGGSSTPGTGSRPTIVRLTSTGSLDSQFGDGGVFQFTGPSAGSGIYSMAVRPFGDMVAMGLNMLPLQVSFNGNATSQLSPPFKPQAIDGAVTLGDGRVVGAGEQNVSGNNYQIVVVRLDVTDLPDPDCIQCGEMSGDCRITTADALLALKMAVGQITPNLKADMNGSGTITSADALAILKVAVGGGVPVPTCPGT